MKRLWGTLTISLLPGAVFADGIGDGYYHHMDGWGYGFMGFGMMLVFFAVVAVIVIVAVRLVGREQLVPGPRGSDALDILRERLARGEIEVEEFEARKKALGA